MLYFQHIFNLGTTVQEAEVDQYQYVPLSTIFTVGDFQVYGHLLVIYFNIQTTKRYGN